MPPKKAKAKSKKGGGQAIPVDAHMEDEVSSSGSESGSEGGGKSDSRSSRRGESDGGGDEVGSSVTDLQLASKAESHAQPASPTPIASSLPAPRTPTTSATKKTGKNQKTQTPPSAKSSKGKLASKLAAKKMSPKKGKPLNVKSMPYLFLLCALFDHGPGP